VAAPAGAGTKGGLVCSNHLSRPEIFFVSTLEPAPGSATWEAEDPISSESKG